MQWDDLRFVLALERARTLSAAARELGVAHTTVSRRLRGLEKSLGVALFERAGDQFEATAAGRDLCRVAARVEEEIFGAERRVMGRDRKLVGKLRVTTFDVVSVGMFPLFAAFRRHYPAVELTLTTDDRALSLHRREADVALRLSREPPPSLVGRRVGKIHFAVYGARALVEAVGDHPPCEAFPWLHWAERLHNRWNGASPTATSACCSARCGSASGFTSCRVSWPTKIRISSASAACSTNSPSPSGCSPSRSCGDDGGFAPSPTSSRTIAAPKRHGSRGGGLPMTAERQFKTRGAEKANSATSASNSEPSGRTMR